ncbi:hypothetical protein [Hyalangium versicolor]|uniref:hypothetical protein n=1 Tax=Hyalangium versicolor TaxID=2861190 RepID=UPI001CC9062D|nr:hypothetical protein [Hyalangium versicolor]
MPESAKKIPRRSLKDALLLMARDDGSPVLAHGLPLDVAQTLLPQRLETNVLASLHDAGGDPNDLTHQKWGIVAPEGPLGDELLGHIRPLLRAREAEQQENALIYRVPPRMSTVQARAWGRQILLHRSHPQGPPRYLLLLGDLDQVPLELQLALNSECYVGRLAFPAGSGYAAYAAKVLHWERRVQRPAARMLFFTAHDATPATRLSYRELMAPTLQQCIEDHARGSFQAKEIIEVGDHSNWGCGPLLRQAAVPIPSTLLTLSHGIGAPRRGGWSSDEEQRRRQGSMSLGTESLEASHVEKRRFLPGGFWFNVSCFGAGTPSQSSYFPWLKRLQEEKLFNEPLETVLESLARKEPFVCALPQSVLANPEGPLAVIGHVDLAWTLAYCEKYGGHPSHFANALRLVMSGCRVGLAIHVLGRAAANLYADLGARLQEIEQARAWNLPPPAFPSLHLLWMTCNDLSGYVLLGDPAVQLPLRAPKAKPRTSRPPRQRKP